MSKQPEAKPWPVQEVCYVEVALSEVTTRHLHIEFDHGIRIVVTNEGQLPLAAKLITFLRKASKSSSKGGLQ